jgi:pimeloyl-ACP methyl ester carboxylesterase
VRANADLAPDAALLLAQGAIGPDPERPGMLAWKWDPLLRARSPLPVTQEVLQTIVAHVRAPVLLLRAERGRLPSAEDLRTALSAVPALTIETVPGVSHHLHLEQPQLVAARIVRAWQETGG